MARSTSIGRSRPSSPPAACATSTPSSASAKAALDKGLSDQNEAFAKHLLASSLLERGAAVCEMIFGRGAPPPQWPELRQIGLADFERALQCDPQLAEANLLIARLQALPGGDRKRAMSAINELVRLSA